MRKITGGNRRIQKFAQLFPSISREYIHHEDIVASCYGVDLIVIAAEMLTILGLIWCGGTIHSRAKIDAESFVFITLFVWPPWNSMFPAKTCQLGWWLCDPLLKMFLNAFPPLILIAYCDDYLAARIGTK